MPWAIGAEVAVRTFGNRRGVVVAVAGDGRHRVRMNSVLMWVLEQDLAAPAETRRKRHRPSAQDAPAPSPPAPVTGERLDLHGLRVEEAMARVMEAIDRALLRGADRLEVVHGKGSGRLRAALHRRLAELSVVSAHRLDPGNPGVTWVYF